MYDGKTCLSQNKSIYSICTSYAIITSLTTLDHSFAKSIMMSPPGIRNVAYLSYL